MEKETTENKVEDLTKQKSQVAQKSKPKKTIQHGYVAQGEGNKEVIAPPGQLAVEGLSKPDENFDIGQKTYKFEGDTQEIIDFLEKNKEMTFTAKTLGEDGNWGTGKDPENSNVSISLSTPQPKGPQTHSELYVDNAKKFLSSAIKPGISEALGIAGNQIKEGNSSISETLANINLTQAIENTAAEGISDKKAGKQLVSGLTGHTNGSPVITNSESFGGKIQRAKNKIHKTIQKSGITKLPVVGSKLKAFGKNIIVSINPYTKTNQQGTSHINLGKPKVTFGEIAQQLREKVLAEKTTQQQETSVEQKTDVPIQQQNSSGQKSENQSNPKKASNSETKNTSKQKSNQEVKTQQKLQKSHSFSEMTNAQNQKPSLRKTKSMGHLSNKNLKRTKSNASKMKL